MIKNIKGTEANFAGLLATAPVVASIGPQHLAMRARRAHNYDEDEKEEQDQYPPHAAPSIYARRAQALRETSALSHGRQVNVCDFQLQFDLAAQRGEGQEHLGNMSWSEGQQPAGQRAKSESER